MQIIKQLSLADDAASPPTFLQISFADSSPQVQVTTQLRHAWTHDPDASGPRTGHSHGFDADTGRSLCYGDVGTFVKEGMSRRDEENKALPRSKDVTIHNEWRDEVYHFWNHVFFDVGNFVAAKFREQEDGDGVGRFQPPNSEAMGLCYSEADPAPLEYSWDTDVLLIPAHLEEGVKVQLHSVDQQQLHGTFFDDSTPAAIWYVRRGTPVSLFLSSSGGGESLREGLAAVLAIGIFLPQASDPDDPPGRPQQSAMTEEEMREADMQAEVQSAMQNVMALAMQHRASEV